MSYAERPPAPPDGGYGWVILGACFWLNVQVGAAYTMFGVLFLYLPNSFPVSNVILTSANALQIMSLALGVFVGPLIKRFGCRTVAIIGNIFIFVGLFLCFFVETIELFYVAYGLLPGFGYACCMTTGMVAVQEWFDKRRSLAVGMASVGISAGIFAWPSLIRWLASLYGWRGAVLLAAGIELNGIAAGALLRPISKYHASTKISPDTQSYIDDSEEASLPDILNTVDEDADGSNGTGWPYNKHNVKTIDIKHYTENNKNHMRESRRNSYLPQAAAATTLAATPAAANSTVIHLVVTINNDSANIGEVTIYQNRDSEVYNGDVQQGDKSSAPNHSTPHNNHMYTHPYVQTISNPKTSNMSSPAYRRKHEQGDPQTNTSLGWRPLSTRGRLMSLPSTTRLAAHLQRLPGSPMSHRYTTKTEEEVKPGCCSKTTCLGIDRSLVCYVPFILFIVGGCFTTSGHMMPIAYTPIRSAYLGFEDDQSVLLVSILGMTNIVGRVFFGWIGDRTFVNRTILYGVSSALTGAATAASTSMKTYLLSAVYQAFVGFSQGAYHSIQGAVVVDIVGKKHLARGVGIFMLALGLPNINHIIAGLVIDYTGDPNLLFLVFGCVQLAGGILVCFIPLVVYQVGPLQDIEEDNYMADKEDTISLDSFESVLHAHPAHL